MKGWQRIGREDKQGRRRRAEESLEGIQDRRGSETIPGSCWISRPSLIDGYRQSAGTSLSVGGMQRDTYWDTEVELGQLQGGPEDVVRWFAGML